MKLEDIVEFETPNIIEKAKKEGRKSLLEYEAKTICKEYGLPTTNFKIAKSEKEAKRIANEIGYPIVMKIVSPDILHKTDYGGVVLGIENEEQVENAYKRIIKNVKDKVPDARLEGVLIEEMAPKTAREVIIGGIEDKNFGHVIVFGLGGIWVEVLKDVSYRLVSILEEQDVRDMIKEIKGYKILTGIRGMKPVNEDMLIEMIMRTAKLLENHPEIKELDLNPVVLYENNAKILDARIIL
ncbi:MAG: acetate--CoA ligase family protein [Candidatus Parvarchaeota archaeon]|nr:acetate--CoA ligase family protein [Candidatus Jingweiarchaeum tengchongense]MCW1298672.1 acetate--CoA ligase family protein [Candidatus Jingweiarchaeum tengchongense]MCW1300514.1 acetate--CoA ligase family protein [Candidatus Jingweiarchaeum tengchongense]MCW1304671.1 acetate--CoA ligase family protein [Candidatus Jingweiarchaeum tengchongense]MCW1305860.1 acetate--CoA ligase family protein [Candidatus Jingweiarchaeum tengchongense]